MNLQKYKKTMFLVVCLTAALTFGRHEAGHAASTLEILPAGDGVFTIQGTGIEGAGAMDITVLYDTSSLANPRVVQGGLISGALMVVNDKSPVVSLGTDITVTASAWRICCTKCRSTPYPFSKASISASWAFQVE